MKSTRLSNKPNVFSTIASKVAHAAGHPITFALAVVVIVVWACLGTVFRFSDTWQLVINTATTIITFLMVFLIQNTQNRDAVAIQIKLDELLRVSKGHNALMDLEELSQEDLDRLRRHYVHLASKARKDLDHGKKDTDSPFVAID